MKYSFGNAKAKGKKEIQYFENNGSRGVYHDGWFACTFGPLYPWLTVSPGLAEWDSEKDVWELYDLRKDFSQANDLAEKYPKKLAEMKKLFLKEAKKNKAFPIGGGLWTRLHPEDRIKSPYTSWTFDSNTIRMPEFTAPGLGRQNNEVTIDLEADDNSNGVLYSLGGFSGGLTFFAEDSKLVYEYNMMMIERYTIETKDKLSKGKHNIEIITHLKDEKPMSEAKITINVDGKEWASGIVGRTVPAAFTASETFNVGIDLGSSVSERYFDKAPFRFNGKINSVKVELI